MRQESRYRDGANDEPHVPPFTQPPPEETPETKQRPLEGIGSDPVAAGRMFMGLYDDGGGAEAQGGPVAAMDPVEAKALKIKALQAHIEHIHAIDREMARIDREMED